jgi:LuxR family maltose regulon positive regulatory protein
MVPVPRWRPVARQRLFALLDDGTQGPMTLLAAPAGYGKTLLLTGWATSEGPPGPVAWVRVGPGDHHPRRFWAHVLAALDGAGVVRPDGLLAGLNPRLEIGDEFLRVLVGGLSELDGPVVLILDDLHEATGQAVVGQLRFLLRHAPPQLRLVVATRADPPLALHRLRVAGQLSEIREAELAFTLEETRRLLEDHGVVLTAGELETLRRRTEGWAAGLRLAALSLRAHPRPERFVADLAGDDRAIAGYLVEEVLAAQPPELRAFLLRTSVVERLCGDLADALTGGADGARVLARLEREHVFTSATGPTRTWYRYGPSCATSTPPSCPTCTAGRPPGTPATASRCPPSATPWPPATSTRRPPSSPRAGRRCWSRDRRPRSGSWCRGCPATACGPPRSWPLSPP